MKRQKSNSLRRRGLSLAEVMIALTIMAMLIVATGTAFDAAFSNYKSNHDLANVSVAARNALHQMTTSLRSAWNLDSAVDPDYAIDIYKDAVTDDEFCAFRDADLRDVIYRYDKSDNQLLVSIDDPTKEYVMVDDVYPVPGGDPSIFTATDGPDNNVARVEIRFMVAREGLTRTVSAAAVPRNILFGL